MQNSYSVLLLEASEPIQGLDKKVVIILVNCKSEFSFIVKGHQVQLCQTYVHIIN